MYKELIEKVSAWWDETYPEDVFTGVSGDIGAIKVKEIRDLLNKAKEKELVSRGNIERYLRDFLARKKANVNMETWENMIEFAWEWEKVVLEEQEPKWQALPNSDGW